MKNELKIYGPSSEGFYALSHEEEQDSVPEWAYVWDLEAAQEALEESGD